jgi:hypothetical protein
MESDGLKKARSIVKSIPCRDTKIIKDAISNGSSEGRHMLHSVTVILITLICVAVPCKVEGRGTCVESILSCTQKSVLP